MQRYMVIHYTVLVYMPVLLYVNTTQKPYTHTVLVHTDGQALFVYGEIQILLLTRCRLTLIPLAPVCIIYDTHNWHCGWLTLIPLAPVCIIYDTHNWHCGWYGKNSMCWAVLLHYAQSTYWQAFENKEIKYLKRLSLSTLYCLFFVLVLLLSTVNIILNDYRNFES